MIFSKKKVLTPWFCTGKSHDPSFARPRFTPKFCPPPSLYLPSSIRNPRAGRKVEVSIKIDLFQTINQYTRDAQLHIPKHKREINKLKKEDPYN